jgi:hypothetical protein
MDQKELTFERQINGIQFYKYPYLDIAIATNPSTAIQDLWKVWKGSIQNQEDAAFLLQRIVDRSRSIGLQVYLFIQSIDRLPEDHRLTTAILSLQQHHNIFSNPPSTATYTAESLVRLLGLANS